MSKTAIKEHMDYAISGMEQLHLAMAEALKDVSKHIAMREAAKIMEQTGLNISDRSGPSTVLHFYGAKPTLQTAI